MLEREKLVKLKKSLPYGVRAKVSKKLGISRIAVTQALNGTLRNQLAISILEELSKEAKDYKEQVKSKLDLLEATIESL